MGRISITPSLLFFIAKKSNQKRLVQLNASGYLNASSFLKWMLWFFIAFQNLALANQPVKKRIYNCFRTLGKPSLLMYFARYLMRSISIIPLLLFFIAKKSNQKRLVQLNASGYLNASAFLKWMFLFVNAFQYSDLANQPVKKRFIFASAFVVNLRCSYVFLISQWWTFQ